MIEYWDIYDSKRNKTGRIHKRGVKLRSGEFHIVVSVWIVNSKGEILLTKRHPDKDYGNYWECTGGSIVVGEDSITGAKRELFEEIGVSIKDEPMILLGTHQHKEYFLDSYLIRKDILLKNLTLQKEEVLDAKWVNINDFQDMCLKELIVPSVIERFHQYQDEFK